MVLAVTLENAVPKEILGLGEFLFPQFRFLSMLGPNDPLIIEISKFQLFQRMLQLVEIVYQIYKINMNNFDPFFSTDYQRQAKEDKGDIEIEFQPELLKKSDTQFIAQILNHPYETLIKQAAQNTQVNVINERQTQSNRMEQNRKISESESSRKSLSKNSPFHNFQKHLVVTLRQILKLQRLSLKIGAQHELALKIFEYFKKSQKTSRQFLQHIYGLTEAKDALKNAKLQQSIRAGQLGQILTNYQNETLFKAQQILRHSTKLQLDQCDLNECLSNKKIKKKAQFIEYINLFKTQLTSGKQRKKIYKLLAGKLYEPKPKTQGVFEHLPDSQIIVTSR